VKTFFCDKCGYRGANSVGHNIPKSTIECGYIGRLVSDVAISPSNDVWIEWEHVCSKTGERVLTTLGKRCKTCGTTAASTSRTPSTGA
jgi:hypothetical protein